MSLSHLDVAWQHTYLLFWARDPKRSLTHPRTHTTLNTARRTRFSRAFQAQVSTGRKLSTRLLARCDHNTLTRTKTKITDARAMLERSCESRQARRKKRFVTCVFFTTFYDLLEKRINSVLFGQLSKATSEARCISGVLHKGIENGSSIARKRKRWYNSKNETEHDPSSFRQKFLERKNKKEIVNLQTMDRSRIEIKKQTGKNCS